MEPVTPLPMEQREITYKKRDKVYYREFALSKLDDLEVHTIRDIVTLGDGTVIVRHREGIPFLYIDHDTNLEEFTKNASAPITNNPTE